MASLERLLTDDESLVLLVRRHVRVLTSPFLALLVVLGVGRSGHDRPLVRITDVGRGSEGRGR